MDSLSTDELILKFDFARIFFAEEEEEEEEASYVVSLNDITKRERAEEALRESEERFTAFMNNSPIVAWLKDPVTWTFPYINNAFEEVFDITREVITKKTDFDLWPEEIARQLRENDLRVVSSDKTIQTSEDVPLPDGTIHHWLVFKFPLHTPSGKRFLAGTAVDITERKRAEEALRSSEEKYRALIGHMNDGLLVVDNNDAIQFVNEKLCKMVGYLQDELIGKIAYRMLLPEESWKLIQEKNRQRIQEISEQYELEMRKKSGERFWVSVSASPVYGSKGEVIGSMAVISDISVRKLAEEASRQAAEEIGNAHEQLLQLNKHLTEVREEERALISREIHDELGQSLTALKIDLNWTREYIGKKLAVKRKLNTMLDIVNSTIKNVQRIASELRPGILDDLGLASAIEWYCEEFEKRSGIKCRTDLEETRLKDPQKNLTMFRVLQEALTNVIRHANATAVKVNLRYLGEDMNLEIKDDGIGIRREKVFASDSLGLIGMRERTKQFNGRFEIFSEKKKGTTVRISLPIHS